MRFHAKALRLRALRPDLAVVPECACPEVLLRRHMEFDAVNHAWAGSSSRKGLAVFSFGRWRLSERRAVVTRFAHVIRVAVTAPARFGLVATWVASPSRSTAHDVRAVIASAMAEDAVIVAGDFNRSVSHRRNAKAVRAPLGRMLGELGLVSAYHHSRGVEHGQEAEPTFFRHRRRPGAHVDHIFLDPRFRSAVRSVTIVSGEPWIALSDHAPVVVDVALDEPTAIHT
jgi:endonuclease/exonuclease/phosphatase family metal-dependent hydrolase